MNANVLVVDDDQSLCELLETDLVGRGCWVAWRRSAEDALEVLDSEDIDVVLADLNLPGFGGIQLCEQVAASRPDIPVIVITAFGSLETAVSALRAGAYDFVTKPFELEVLARAVSRAAAYRALGERVKRLDRAVARDEHFGPLLGSSPPMRRLYEQVDRIAQSDASVLITGESGTGKELVARALHERGPRHGGRYVPVNCSALPESLLESELFGHTRGAFTGASAARRGLLLEADGGTLLLDEIGELPVSLQAKLLRALEERTVRPLGGNRPIPFDTRILAATNRDIESDVERGRFRSDLYYRINVIRLELPSLRARGEDILLLANHFLTEVAERSGRPVTAISKAAAEKLLEYDWPGNVRELRNAIERAVAITRHDQITLADLPERIRTHRGRHLFLGGTDPRELVPIGEVERRYILHVLDAVGGNRTHAARILGVDRRTLHRKLKLYRTESTDEK